MINVNSSAHALYTLISSNSTIVSSNVTVEKNNIINTDPNRTPWVGVYYQSAAIEPKRANIQNPWMGTDQLEVIIQEGGYNDPEKTYDLLNNLKSLIWSIVNSPAINRTLGGAVDMLVGASSTPLGRDLENEDSLFAEVLTFQYEKLL